MKRTVLIIALFVMLPVTIFAKVVEENKMAKALQGIDKSTLLIVDIDNTLIEPVQQLGSSQWYSYEYNKYLKDGLSEKDASKRTFDQWALILRTAKMKPVEMTTPGLIYAAQRKGINVVALTARPGSVKDITVEELRMAGIDLSLKTPSKSVIRFAQKYNDSGYFSGIIFADLDNDKGLILNEFLAKTGIRPKRVIFVDDIKKNVEAVDKALAEKGIECQCVRYGAADARVKAFDPKVADVQLENLGQDISDKEAKKLSKKKK